MSDPVDVQEQVRGFSRDVGRLRDEVGQGHRRPRADRRGRGHGAARRRPRAARGRARPGQDACWCARSPTRCDLTFSRIQFTPDLMPADIIGTNIIVEDAAAASASSSSAARSSPTSCSPTRSTAPRPRRSRRCSRRCRSSRSPSAKTTYKLDDAVLRAGHAEPARDGGHLSAARGAARSLLLQAAASSIPSREALHTILDRTTGAATRCAPRRCCRRRGCSSCASWCARCRWRARCRTSPCASSRRTHPGGAAPPECRR